MSFHGGLVGAALALWMFARRRGVPVLSVFDIIATVVPIGLFFGRLANFVNGELWGRPAPDFPYAIVFPDNAGPVRATQPGLYLEAATEGVLLFIVLAVIVRRIGFHRPGLIAGIFGIGYAVSRIFCEFFREPDAQLGYPVRWFGELAWRRDHYGYAAVPADAAVGIFLIVQANRSSAPSKPVKAA